MSFVSLELFESWRFEALNTSSWSVTNKITPDSQSLWFKCGCPGHTGPARADSWLWLWPAVWPSVKNTPLSAPVSSSGFNKCLSCSLLHLAPCITLQLVGKGNFGLLATCHKSSCRGKASWNSPNHWWWKPGNLTLSLPIGWREGRCAAAVCSLENANRKLIK